MEAIIIILLILLMMGGLLFLFVAYKYFSLKSQLALEIQSKLQEKFQKWQNEQVKDIQKQMYSAAKGDAISEAQKQLNQWRENDMLQLKGQIEQSVSKQFEAKLEQWKIDTEKTIRQDAIQKSQSVTLGKVTEHIVPYLPSFKYNPKDARFLGSPVDFVLFDGLDEGQVRRVLFIEIKTRKSQLSTRERQIRNAINDGRVKWVEIKINGSQEKNSSNPKMDDVNDDFDVGDKLEDSGNNLKIDIEEDTDEQAMDHDVVSSSNIAAREKNLESMYLEGKISKETFEYMRNKIAASRL